MHSRITWEFKTPSALTSPHQLSKATQGRVGAPRLKLPRALGVTSLESLRPLLTCPLPQKASSTSPLKVGLLFPSVSIAGQHCLVEYLCVCAGCLMRKSCVVMDITPSPVLLAILSPARRTAPGTEEALNGCRMTTLIRNSFYIVYDPFTGLWSMNNACQIAE